MNSVPVSGVSFRRDRVALLVSGCGGGTSFHARQSEYASPYIVQGLLHVFTAHPGRFDGERGHDLTLVLDELQGVDAAPDVVGRQLTQVHQTGLVRSQLLLLADEGQPWTQHNILEKIDKKIRKSHSAEKIERGPFSLARYCMLRLKSRNLKGGPFAIT